MAHDEEGAPIQPFNEWGVTTQRGMVVAFAPPNFPMSPDRALQLAAWLMIAVGLDSPDEEPDQWHRFSKVFSACLNA